MADNPLASLTTQKATAAAAGAIAAPLIGPYIDRFTGGRPYGRILVGVGIAWAGGAMLDGYAESAAIGVGVGLAFTGLLAMVLKVDAPSA